MNNPFGFLIIDKPAGMTSHDCVNVIRKVFKIKRVGHGGTLDPAVTGVLPIAVGNATRLFQYLPREKTYTAIIQLGKQTYTDDMNGEIIFEKEWPILNECFLEDILNNNFKGNIQQKPPLISSVHFQGERAYKKARRGEKFDLPIREITIHKLQVCSWDQETGQLKLIIHCSSGTYIRSLARDLGEKLNCGGHLLRLHRTQTQGFFENQSISLPKFNNEIEPTPLLINPRKALKHLNEIKLLSKEQLECWRKGQQLKISEQISNNFQSQEGLNLNNLSKYLVVVDHNNELAGIGELSTSSLLQPKVVFNAYS